VVVVIAITAGEVTASGRAPHQDGPVRDTNSTYILFSCISFCRTYH